MLTAVERVLILKGADLLREVGPRHLLVLAEVAREIELSVGDVIFQENDSADALYMMVEGRVRLSTGEKTTSEVGPGEAFGTWALVDDSERGQKAECVADGMALARRLRALVAERPEEARVEGEGIEKPEAMLAAEAAVSEPAPDAASQSAPQSAPDAAPQPTPGAALAAAALGQPAPDAPPERTVSNPAISTAEAERAARHLDPTTTDS